MDSYSNSDSQMRIQTDPFPGSVTSHATNLGGEIERIRYQISKIIGQTYWYNDPTRSTPTFADVTVDGTSPSFILSESGTPQAQLIIDANDTYLDYGGAQGRIFFRHGINGTTIMTLGPSVLDLGSHKIQSVAQGSNAGEAIVYPVTSSEIQNGTITGTQITSSVNLPGNPTTTTPPVNSASTLIATTAFVNPANSIGSSGYQKLASGLILQWGLSSVISQGGGTQTITFPVAFPSAVFGIQATIRTTNASPDNGVVAPQVGSIITSQFVLKNMDVDSSWDAYWFAIGV